MIDPGAVGSDESQGQNRHWLVNGATIVGKRSSTAHPTEHQVTSCFQTTRSTLMLPPQSPHMQDPLPLPVPDHTGQWANAVYFFRNAFSRARRYTIVIYTQGANFAPPQNLSGPVPGVELFDFPNYVKSTNLGPLVAGIYYQVEAGTATVSIPATSSVVTSTLPAAHSSSSGNPSGTSSGSKPSSTGTSNNTGGAMGKLVSGSLLSVTVVLGYIML